MNHFDDLCYEAEQRHVRRKNIVVSGVHEQLSGTVQERKVMDEKYVEKLAIALGLC